MAQSKRTSTRGRKSSSRGSSRSGSGSSRSRSSGSRNWGDRWRSKSLVGHAKTHPYASAALAAAAAGAGALIWSRMGPSNEQNMPAMAI
jgi:hypothetical protein